MGVSLRAVVLLACLITPATAMEAKANPIRKVVTLLQAMQSKVTAEGEKEKELYEKFMCYCKNNGGDLKESIAAAEAKMPNVLADIEAAEAKLTQSKEDLKQAQVDRKAAKDAMAEATAIREKEAAAFAAEKAEFDANIAAITKAYTAVEKGMGSAFLQTEAATVLRKLVQDSQNLMDDRQELAAFLQNGAGGAYAPQSGQIVGILKQMGDTMAADLAGITAEEDKAIKGYEGLMAAKAKEVKALTEQIEAKTKLIGELGVEIVQMKEDLDDTGKALYEDKKFLAQLEKGCSTKEAEWEERSKVRAEELVALADTIKVLNDDDALDLFKKTMPSPGSSFLQVQVSSKAMRDRALAALREAQKKESRHGSRARLDFLVLALSGKQALSQKGFEKVIKMIDDMVDVLKKEQVDDDDKKEYCELSFDTADDKKKAVERSISDTETAIADTKEAIATLTEEIAALEKGIKALDKQVAEATEQRKEEDAEYKELMASDAAAKELLGFAKNRLNKFYNPKLYKAPPKVELSAEDKITVNMGGTLAPTAAPGGIAGTGVTVFAQVSLHTQQEDKAAPPPPPATWDAYAKKSEENTGVISMIDLLIADLDKEMTEATTEEKNSQKDYEELMADSAEKRTTDTKNLADKTAAKADLEADLVESEAELKAGQKELMATLKYIQSLHSECDWLVKYFDVRKEARTGEIDSLVKAKAVLSGADYSLLQTSRRGYLRH